MSQRDAGRRARQGGTLVTITGTHLAATTAVNFGGVESTDVDVLDDKTVTALAPAGALGSADIVLTSPGGTSTLTAAFTYTEPPTLRLGATEVSWGSKLDVSGHGFAPGTDVVVTLHSDPVVLGELPAGADGRFDLAATIPEVDPGAHEITAEGVDAYGAPLSMAVDLNVAGGATPTTPAAPGDPSATDAAGTTRRHAAQDRHGPDQPAPRGHRAPRRRRRVDPVPTPYVVLSRALRPGKGTPDGEDHPRAVARSRCRPGRRSRRRCSVTWRPRCSTSACTVCGCSPRSRPRRPCASAPNDDGGLLTASVGVWVDSIDERQPVLDALAAAGCTTHAFLVTESVPLAYADRSWPEGSRRPAWRCSRCSTSGTG